SAQYTFAYRALLPFPTRRSSDLDGVISHDSDAYIKSPQEWHPIEGSLEAIAQLKRAGFRVVIASNQSGIGRGLFTCSDLEAIHAKMTRMLGTDGTVIDGIFFCPHKPEDKCNCRKPRPGLLEQIMNRWGLLPKNCLLVGDSLRDIQAANAVN